MHFYCLEILFSLQSSSLKEKQGIIKSIVSRARYRFNVSCAETDHQDNHHLEVLTFVTVCPDKSIARTTMEKVEEWIYENWPDVEIIGNDISEV